MNVKTLVISAAAVVVLGGGAFVAVKSFGGDAAGGLSGQPATYRPYAEAKKNKQQLWFDSASATKWTTPTNLIVVKNGKMVQYLTRDSKNLSFGDIDKLSDAEIIKRAKAADKASYEEQRNEHWENLAQDVQGGYTGDWSLSDIQSTFQYQAPEPKSIKVTLETDDSGNNVKSEHWKIKYSKLDYYKFAEAPASQMLNRLSKNDFETQTRTLYLDFTAPAEVKTVLTHDYWGYSKGGSGFLYQRVKSGAKTPTPELDDVNTKGAKVE